MNGAPYDSNRTSESEAHSGQRRCGTIRLVVLWRIADIRIHWARGLLFDFGTFALQKMFISTAIGLAVMAGSFVFMEWLNHAVVHGDRSLARPEYSQALIKGVPNITLLYVCATFFALALLWALPFPQRDSSGMQDGGGMGKAVRLAIFGATTVLLVGVLVDASSKVSGTVSGQHGRAH
jgi:hypothetical protein